LKLLGSLYDVGAFLERKEITTINRSEDIRARLLSRLQSVTVDVDAKVDDALDLLAEIREGRGSDDGAGAAPTVGAPADMAVAGGGYGSHTIPLKQSQPEQGHPSTLTDGEVVFDFDR
jgi:hypothetical protein